MKINSPSLSLPVGLARLQLEAEAEVRERHVAIPAHQDVVQPHVAVQHAPGYSMYVLTPRGVTLL